jgi:MFS family permease
MQTQRLSKAFFLGSYLGGTIATWIIAWIIWALVLIYVEADESVWMFIWPFLLAVPISVYLFVVQCVFVYKAWASIQDGHVRTGPCKVLGFLFIPFFNFYWIFQAVWGFAVDFNKYVVRNNVSAAPKLPEGLFLTYSILYVVAIIPFVGFAIGIANFVIGAILISKVCDAVNALPPPSPKSNPA